MKKEDMETMTLTGCIEGKRDSEIVETVETRSDRWQQNKATNDRKMWRVMITLKKYGI